MKSLRRFVLHHKTAIILSVILLLAAYLRLYRISDYMTFLGDEGRDLLEVQKILSGHLVFLGPRSSAADFYYGPIYFYMITPFLWLFRGDPVGPAVFIALLGIATVYLVYYVGKKMIDERTGLIAAALYTVSPLVIAYSRSSWNPNPLPFVSLLSLFLIYKGIKDRYIKLFLFVGFLMGIAIQLQYLAVFLGIIIFLFVTIGVLLDKKTRSFIYLLKSYALLLAGYIIGWSPFLVFEIRHGFPNLRTIIRFMLHGSPDNQPSSQITFVSQIGSVFFKLFARLITRFPPPEQVNVSKHPELLWWEIGTIILGILSVLLIFKIKNKLAVLMFSLWFFVGILLFGFYRRDVYDYYLGYMFPLPFLLVAQFLSYVYTSRKFVLMSKLFVVVLFLVLFIYNFNGNPFNYPPNRQKDQVKEIASFVLSKTNNKPYNFALLTSGNSDHAYRYYLGILGKSPTEIKNTVIDPKRTTVTTQLMVVCEDPNCQPLGSGLWEVAGFGRAEITGEWPVSVVKIYKLVHYKGK